MKTHLQKEPGFTLIELVMALSIFSLILLIAYQALVQTAQSKLRVSESVNQQNELRSAYRVLGDAFEAGAKLTGHRYRVELDLTMADSRWLAGSKHIVFEIDEDQALWASLDNDQPSSLLLSALDQAEFRYLDGEQIHASWDSAQSPALIELSWFDDGEPQAWRFAGR